MTRKPPITEEQVFNAANTLDGQGKEVTPKALLGLLGSGSYSTIYKYLASWEANRANTLSAQPAGEAPEVVKSAFATVWRVVTTEAAKEITAVREKATEEIRSTEKKLLEALETIEKLERESEADTVQIEQLTDKLAGSEKELHKVQADNAALQATNEELNKRIHAQETERERMHKDLDNERMRNQHDRERMENLQKDLAALITRLDKKELA